MTVAEARADGQSRLADGAVPTVSLSVVVPTHARPDCLERCLDGLRRQLLTPKEIIVVHARGDAQSAAVIKRFPHVREILIDQPSVLAGLRAGAQAATGDVICFTDDDAVPRSDWTLKLAHAFADHAVGAVGGRDIQESRDGVEHLLVGRVTRWGKLIGNHHRGAGQSRCVDVLKGVNMAFRREALAIPRDLKGRGTEPNYEVAMGLWATANDWKLVFDPAIIVDHLVSPKRDGGRREALNRRREFAAAFNLVYGICSTRPEIALRRCVYGVLLGDGGYPGLVRAVLGLARRETGLLEKFIPSILGQLWAVGTLLRGRRLEMTTLPVTR